MTIETNPPAFPRPSTDHGTYGSPGQDGMTLRDYFAAHAPPHPPGFHIVEPDLLSLDEDGARLGWAKYCVDRQVAWSNAYADAMLTASKGPDHGRG